MVFVRNYYRITWSYIYTSSPDIFAFRYRRYSPVLSVFNNSSNCFFTSSAVFANRCRLSLGNSAPSGSVLPRHTALVPVNSIPLQKNFGELLQFWVQLSLSASSLVFGHLHWSFWNVWSNILYEGFPSWSLATGFSILLIWLIIRSLAILPSAYPDSPGVGFSILLLLILQIDGRMFSHHPPFLCLTFPGLTFLIATFHPFQSILPIDPRVLIV